MRQYFFLFLFLATLAPAFGQNKNYEEGLKAFDAEDYMKAFKLLKPFAESGNAMAEFVLGSCYLNPGLDLKNDSLAEHYLLSAAEKYHPESMGMLSLYYLQKGSENEQLKIQALVWAEIAAAYKPAFSSTKALIKHSLNQQELKEAEKILKEKKSRYDKIDLGSFYKLNKRPALNNKILIKPLSRKINIT